MRVASCASRHNRKSDAATAERNVLDDGGRRCDTNGQQGSLARPLLDDVGERHRKEAPATRAAASVLAVASAAISRPPGRRQGTSAASQRAASAAGSPATFSTTSARSDAPAQRQLAAGERDVQRRCFCLGAPLRCAARSAAPAASTSTSAAPRARDGVAQPRRAQHDHGRAPLGPAQQRRQRWCAAERPGK